MYVHLLFDLRTEKDGWCLHQFSAYDCDPCNETQRSPRPCRRGTPWIQAPMLQVFIDLHMWNEGLSNREKRFHCYRWYTMIVHGVSTVGGYVLVSKDKFMVSSLQRRAKNMLVLFLSGQFSDPSVIVP